MWLTAVFLRLENVFRKQGWAGGQMYGNRRRCDFEGGTYNATYR